MAQAPVTASCPERIAQLFAGKHVDAVCFDVDSTICTTEGIDEFAAFLNVGDAVAAVTRKAMEGAMDFRTALASRLSAMQITREKLDEFITQHPPILTPGAASLVAALRARGIAVYLVSGGFRPLIAPAAAELGLDPSAHVVANSFVFPPSGGGAAAADTGAFATFDTNEPTSSSGGKARALEAIIAANGYKTVLMVGDGATDLEARPPAVAVIGFGGIADRPAVRAGADWFVYALSDIEVLVTAAVGNAGTDVGSKCEAAGAGERAGAAGDVDAETVV